ncbi:Dabb family protein [Clostridium beijerinckii]|uniref:Dabb family protein n=1 Tax=Clostridium beijerinckii TaxID=1520 RepID=UPI00047A69A2|nr:Dabb family protein [Clostridium beijerinckii]
MIINNLLLKLKDRDINNIKQTQNTLLKMKGKISVLLDIQAELNIRPNKTNYDIILITKFQSLEDMNSYLTHPVHLEVAKFIGSVLDTQASVCYEL